MTERLGFNDMLIFLALGGIGAFALGTIIADSAGFDGIDSKDQDNFRATGDMLMHLGMIAVGTAIILAAIRAEGHSTAIRAVMLVIGAAIIFGMLNFGFTTSVGR